MQELSFGEIEQVNGGIEEHEEYEQNPMSWALGVLGGVVGNYIYESVGGKEGIDRLINAAIPKTPTDSDGIVTAQ